MLRVSRPAETPSQLRDSALLVGAEEFVDAVEPAILRARQRVLLQVMTFELDSVGRHFWELLVRSPATEKVLCVDAFSTAKISDDLVCSPRYLLDSAFRREVRETRRLLGRAEREGVRIAVTNPMGFLWRKFPVRNHKKMMIVDDQCFLGGINLSEHNFEWRDMMMRCGSPDLVDALAEDFHRTLDGEDVSRVVSTAEGRLFLLNGRRSRKEYDELFAVMERAKETVDVITPYVSEPLLGRLAALPPSVWVRIINPARNNKPALQQELFRAATGSNLEVLLYQPAMSHIKAVLVDGQQLILGSCNFDFVAYDVQQEVVLSTDDPALVGDFRERVLEPILSDSLPAESAPARFYHRAGLGVPLARWYIRLLSYLN